MTPEPSPTAFPEIERGGDWTVRDDQHDPAWLLDAVRICRRRGGRFRLIDSGTLDRFQLEWLLKAGADFYSSDDARCNLAELEDLSFVGRRAGGRIAYFLNGEISPADEEGDGFPLLGRGGIGIHVSSRERARDYGRLAVLAESCVEGGGRLVYYHHGSLDPALEGVARAGAWIHLGEASFPENSDARPLVDIQRAARSRGTDLIVHLEKKTGPSLLEDLLESGAVLLFKLRPLDYRSPLKPLERAASRRRPPDGAYYLYPDILH